MKDKKNQSNHMSALAKYITIFGLTILAIIVVARAASLRKRKSRRNHRTIDVCRK